MEKKKLHFMGIGGAGISAVAAFAVDAGFEVTGCDIDENSPFLPELKKLGIHVSTSHSPDHLVDIDLLVVSTAVPSLDSKNSELLFAQEKGISLLTGEEFLAKNILPGKKVIAVAGTHGKSTTTAMLGWVLEKAGLDPSVMVGARVQDWDTNYRVGKSEYFVIEADEFQEKFLLYNPNVALVTAVEMDHPEYFSDEEAVLTAFEKFVKRINSGGCLILGPNVKLHNSNGKTIPFSKKDFSLRLIGKFNQENASLVYEACKILGVDNSAIVDALEVFNGIARRFDFKGEEKGVKVFEDYAHHPTAVKVTIQAVREKFPQSKLWVVFQPHMFTRTAYLLTEFVRVFKNLPADTVILVDIFAAREAVNKDISSKTIVDLVRKENVKYIGDLEKTAYFIVEKAQVSDVVVVMGAGSVYKLSEMILTKLRNKK